VLILGIETSCDETAAAVVESGRAVRSSVVASQVDLHREYGGVVPEIASRAHIERILPAVRGAVREAGVTLRDVDAVAVGHRPGLIGSLLVGVAAAKALAWSLEVPIVGVDHVHAHLHAALLDRQHVGEEIYPALGLVVSGGHTAIYRVEDAVTLRRLGATIDDAVGEAYDKAAAILGLPYPGGPEIDRLASSVEDTRDESVLPMSMLAPESLDFSFSGVKTALLYRVQGVPKPRNRGGGPAGEPPMPLDDRRRAALAAVFQRAAVGAVIAKLDRAFDQQPDARSLLAGGGVTANSMLRAELARLGSTRGIGLFIPPLEYCVDNAAMIAGLAHERLVRGRSDDLSLAPVPTTAC